MLEYIDTECLSYKTDLKVGFLSHKTDSENKIHFNIWYRQTNLWTK